ncbi:acyltransferase [Acidithiobacillus caldus]
MRRTLSGLLVGLFGFTAAAAYGSGATNNAVAMQRIAQDRQMAPKPNYAWTHPYCLRYRSAHPDLLILGDSIFDGWSGYLLHVFPGALVDARVGRQFASAIPIYQKLRAYPGVRAIGTVVVELGTNGPVTSEQVDQFLRLVGPRRRVVFIVPEVPRPWGPEVQDLYASLPQAYPNVRLVYWNRIASLPDGRENGAYFWGDEVHPNWQGIRALVGGLGAVLEGDRS